MENFSARCRDGVPRSKGRNWRGGVAPAARPTSEASWATVQTRHRGQVSRWLVRIGLFTLLAACVVGFVIFVAYRPVPTPLVVMRITRYDAPTPPNAFSREDELKLRAAFEPKGNAIGVSVGENAAWVKRDDLDAQGSNEPKLTVDEFLNELTKTISGAKPGGPGKNVVLVYLSLHGVLDKAGKACLVVAEPLTLRDSDSAAMAWRLPLVPMQAVLDKVGTLHPRKKKVLLLDCSRIERSWQLGIAENGFAAKLKELTPPDDVYLVNSCSAGEAGLAYPEHGCSAFGYFVCRGLYGEADLNRQGDITLWELQKYLDSRVNNWAQLKRRRTQQPFVVPEVDAKSDFIIAAADHKAKSQDAVVKSTAPAKIPADWGAVASLWDEYQQLFKRDDVPAELVLKGEALRQGLLRLEQLRLAGSAYDTQATALQNSLEQLVAHNKQATTRMSGPAYSLPLAFGTTEPNDKDLTAARNLLLKPPKPEDKAVPAPRPDARYFAWAIWERACTDVRAADDFNGILHRLAIDMPQPETVEMRTLRRFGRDGHLPKTIRSEQNAELLQAAILCRRAAENAAFAAGDERVFHLVRALVEGADNDRRIAEDYLYCNQPEPAKAKFRAAEDQYERAKNLANELHALLQLRDRTWADLPYYLEWSVSGPETEDLLTDVDTAAQQALGALPGKARELLQKLTELSVRLETILQFDEDSPAEPAGLSQSIVAAGKLKTSIEQILKDLNGPYQVAKDYVTQIATKQGQHPHLLAKTLLRAPLSEAADRQQLWDVYLKFTAEAAQDDAPLSETAKGANAEAADVAETTAASPAVALLATWREARTELAKSAPAPQVDLSSKANSDPVVLADWFQTAVSESLAALNKPAERSSRAKQRRPYSLSDLRLRADAAWLALDPNYVKTNGDEPARVLRNFDRHHFLVWQAKRVVEDFWGAADAPDASKGGDPYFQKVAEQYLVAAEMQWTARSGAHTATRDLCSTYAKTAGDLRYKFEHHSDDIPRLEIEDGKPGSDLVRIPLPKELFLTGSLASGTASLQVVDRNNETVPFNAAQRDAFSAADLRDYLAHPLSAKDAQLTPAEIAFSRARILSDAQSPWSVAFYYRGHTGALSVPVGKLVPGPAIVWQRPVAQEGTIYIEPNGDGGDIALVLDCSKSMEAAFGNGNRFQAALRALDQLTETLGQSGKFRMTLWLFAHRRSSDSTKLVKNPANMTIEIPWVDGPVGIPDFQKTGINFANDCQLVWQGSAPDDALRAMLDPERTQIKPMGYTPLYYTLQKVVDDDLSKREKRSSFRRLIVLSDGADMIPPMPRRQDGFRYDPPWVGDLSAAARQQKADELLDSLRKDLVQRPEAPIGVYMVYCASDKTALTNFNQELLLRDRRKWPGGTQEATGAEKLMIGLSEAAGIYNYTLLDPDGEPKTLSTSSAERIALGNGRPYKLRLQASGKSATETQFEIRGGEALWFKVQESPAAVRLVHSRWRAEDERAKAEHVKSPSGDASNPDFRPAEFYLAAYLPKRSDTLGSVDFTVSVQNQNEERFSPRPTEIWAQIVPAKSRGFDAEPVALEGVAPYYYSDPLFQPNERAPVLHFHAPKWPRAADTALVRVWFKLEHDGRETHPSLPLQDYLDEAGGVSRLDTQGELAKIDLLVNREVDPDDQSQIVQIIEKHPAPFDGSTPWCRVSFSKGTPDVIQRRYFPENGRAEHLFKFSGQSIEQLREHRILVQSLEEWKKNAVSPPDALKVPLPRE